MRSDKSHAASRARKRPEGPPERYLKISYLLLPHTVVQRAVPYLISAGAACATVPHRERTDLSRCRPYCAPAGTISYQPS